MAICWIIINPDLLLGQVPLVFLRFSGKTSKLSFAEDLRVTRDRPIVWLESKALVFSPALFDGLHQKVAFSVFHLEYDGQFHFELQKF